MITTWGKNTQDYELAPLLTPQKAGRHLGVVSAIFLMLNRMIGTGIFSIPSSIYGATGSVGLSFVFWIIGGVIMLCGFSVYFEYGLEMPKSGGELNYLGRVYRKPKNLAAVAFAFTGFLLSFSSSNAYAFGLYLQLAFGYTTPSEVLSRWIGGILVIAVVILHGVWPKVGQAAFNSLGLIKVFILASIALCGLLVAAGVLQVPGGKPIDNFKNPFQNDGFGGGAYNWAVALLRISYSYRGWETVNMVMGEVRQPRRTMAIAGPVAIVLIVTLYLLCNFAYFIVVPKEEIVESGVVVAGTFFLRLFGESAAGRVLPFFICLSNLGNVLVVVYACGHMVQEFGKMHLLPFSNVFASTKPFNTPFAGLAVHAVMTVITIALPPAGEVYEFIVDLSTYTVSYFSTAVTLGLIYLHYYADKENWGKKHLSWTSPKLAIVVFLLANLAMLILPWLPPANNGDTKSGGFPYFASPLGALGTILLSIVYWAWWRKTDGPDNLAEYKKLQEEADAFIEL